MVIPPPAEDIIVATADLGLFNYLGELSCDSSHYSE